MNRSRGMTPRSKRNPYSWESVRSALSHHTGTGALAGWTQHTSGAGTTRVVVRFPEAIEDQLLSLREAWVLVVGLTRGERHYGATFQPQPRENP